MDAVAGLLDGPRARGAFLLRSMLAPPWSMRIADEAPLTLLAVVRGSAVVLPDDGEPVRLARGDACLLRGPGAYRVGDEDGTEPQVLVLPGQRCVTPEGREVVMRRHGVRTWGNSPDGETELLTGTYQLDGEVGGRLLRALPPLARSGPTRSRAPDRAAGGGDRARRARPGGRARPPAGPAADRRPARVILPPGCGRARLVPRPRRHGRRACAAADPPRPRAPVTNPAAARHGRTRRAGRRRAGSPPQTTEAAR